MKARSEAPLVAALAALLATANADAAGIAKGPYLMTPTTGGITVCWVSDNRTAGDVKYGVLSGSPEHAEREPIPTRYHRVRITGLQPYTRYAYKVTCDGETQSGTFLTAAPPDQPFKFVAYGDNRTQPNVHAAVLARVRQFQPDFIVQTGDQVADGSSESDWDEFWHVAEKTLSETAYYPALGNHEGNGASYFRYFDVPAEYSFDYGNAHFVALDSNRPPSEYAAQEAWLKRDLAAHQKATWRIVFFHHTPYTCVDIPSRRIAAIRLRARLEPIFLAENVQIVINGHDHAYQHHFARGIHYIVTGGGGAPLYDVTPNTPFVVKARKAHHDCEIRVNGATLSVRAVEPNGTVIEQFEVHAAS